MLVLTRRNGESIQIGEHVKVSVLSVQGRSVKIGIDAPRRITVHRTEIYEKMVEENKKATESISRRSAEKLLNFRSLKDERN